jgi:hypothetical protein
MTHQIPFPLENFESYCKGLHRVGVVPNFVLYTNTYAGNHQPATRVLPAAHFDIAQNYIANPTDEGFRVLVAAGVFLDNEWDRKSEHWVIIAFEGWEVLHTAFSRLYARFDHTLRDLTGVAGLEISDSET